jgi:hypothetical protein
MKTKQLEFNKLKHHSTKSGAQFTRTKGMRTDGRATSESWKKCR